MTNRTVDVAGLHTVLDRYGAGCTVLSLDCFDTLVWRRVVTPTDAFFLLAQRESFRSRGLTAAARTFAETAARRARKAAEDRTEVTLAEIYGHLIPEASQGDIETLVTEELAVEKRICFAFRPVLELIAQARMRGMKVIVVSDTYFNESQLGELIGSTVGAPDASSLFDALYCSSRHGRAKHDGLFDDVVGALAVPADHILHIGDNPAADLQGANDCGVRGVHFTAFTRPIQEASRMAVAAGSMLMPSVRASSPAHELCHALWAQHATQLDAPERVGHTALGPIMLGFARWLADRALAMQNSGENPRLVFLLRDGWLPHRAYERLIAADPRLADIPHSEAEISRFAGYASSFRSVADVDRYLAFMGRQKCYAEMARQLGIPETRAAALVREAERSPDGPKLFRKRIREPRALARIFAAGADYRRRLISYLRSATGVQRGETLLLVDLGYSGTVQTLIHAAVEEELGARVRGAYLLLRDTHETLRGKCGWIDRNNTDSRAIEALIKPISVLEQLCTCDLDSVVDYSEDGQPVRRTGILSKPQAVLRSRIQQAALDFIDAALAPDHRDRWNDAEAVRYTGVSHLGRLLYLPGDTERSTFRQFRHDVNLGTDAEWEFFNTDEAAVGLRRRGLAYVNSAARPTLSMELQPNGITLPLTYFAQSRFRFALQAGDFHGQTETMPVMLSRNNKLAVRDVNVQRTHDGFLLALVNVDDLNTDVGLLFGRRWSLLQLESVSLVSLERLMSQQDDPRGYSLMDSLSFENIERIGGTVLRCRDNSAFLFVKVTGRSPSKAGTRYACAVVFRPLEEQPARDVDASAPHPTLALAG